MLSLRSEFLWTPPTCSLRARFSSRKAAAARASRPVEDASVPPPSKVRPWPRNPPTPPPTDLGTEPDRDRGRGGGGAASEWFPPAPAEDEDDGLRTPPPAVPLLSPLLSTPTSKCQLILRLGEGFKPREDSPSIAEAPPMP